LFLYNAGNRNEHRSPLKIMTIKSIVIIFLIAGVVGAIAQAIVGLSRRGCLASIAIGLAGALLGHYLSKLARLKDLLPLSIGGTEFPLVWSIIGSVVFVTFLALVHGHRKK
jgi:uncharacterized membrane protein YeaQ/YmgE (transglycosylase-associated protein family)